MNTLEPGEKRRIGNYWIRNFKGYFQSREGNKGPWLFYVIGFGGTYPDGVGTCSVRMSDGRSKRVLIDDQHRINIDGRLYGYEHWDH